MKANRLTKLPERKSTYHQGANQLPVFFTGRAKRNSKPASQTRELAPYKAELAPCKAELAPSKVELASCKVELALSKAELASCKVELVPS